MKNEPIRPVRLIVKALILYILFNLMYAIINPPVGRLSVYNSVVPGRERFPFEEARNMFKGYNAPVFENFDAMFASHKLSGSPKTENEYRVFLLGASSIWGYGNAHEETLTAKLNDLNLQTCAGNEVRFYNLGYPKAYMLKDLLILERSLEHDPDMVLWFVTLFGFTGSEIEEDEFLVPYLSDIKDLQDQYQLHDYAQGYEEKTFLDQTIFGERVMLKRMALLQLFSTQWAATGVDHFPDGTSDWKNSIPSDTSYYSSYDSSEDWEKLKGALMMDTLGVGREMMPNVKALVVNGPIYTNASQPDSLRYNPYYPKWAFDPYREELHNYLSDRQIPLIDAWNAIPDAEFSDTPLHLTPAGEIIFADYLAPYILEHSCK